MVGEDQIGGHALPHRARVRFDPLGEAVARAILQEHDLVACVAVEHEDRQKAVDVRTHGRGASEIVPLGMRLLREDDDVVPGSRPFAGDLPCVDVRARAAEEVPVPEQDPHGVKLAF